MIKKLSILFALPLVLMLAVQARGQWLGPNGGSSGGGSSGASFVVQPETYGAVGNGKVVYDASSAGSTASGTGTSISISAMTTSVANELVVGYFASGGPSTFTPPSGLTVQGTLVNGTSTYWGSWEGTVTQASPGSVGPFTASINTSEFWSASLFGLIPTSGNTISAVAGNSCPGNAGTLTCTVPAGISAGQYMLVCISHSSLITGGTGPSAMTLVYTFNATTNRIDCYSRTVASEPSTYTFTGSSLSGQIVVYSNVSGLDSSVSSVSAGFTSANVGNIVCSFVTGTACGSISAVNSATNITTTLTGVLPANSEIRFGTNDTTAFQSAITALSTTGGTIQLGAKAYVLNATLTWPTNVVINMAGAGAALTEYRAYTGSAFVYFPSVAASGSTLMFLATSGGPVLDFPENAVSAWVWTPSAKMSNFSIWAGAGHAGDGAGADCIDSYFQHITFDHVIAANCSGDGFKISDNDGTHGSSYTAEVQIEYGYSVFNNLGIEIAGASNFNQQIAIEHIEVDNNKTYGIEVDGSPLDGAIFDDDIVQWNNTALANPGYDFYVNQPCQGCTVRGSWFEDETANTTTVYVGGTQTLEQGIDFESNFFQTAPAIYINQEVGGAVHNNFFYTCGANTNIFAAASQFGRVSVDNTNRCHTDNGTGAFSTLGNIAGTSGTYRCYEDANGAGDLVMCYLNAYQETGSAETWTFPFSMANAGVLSESGGSCGTFNPTVSATTITLPANAAMTAETCQIIVQGQNSY